MHENALLFHVSTRAVFFKVFDVFYDPFFIQKNDSSNVIWKHSYIIVITYSGQSCIWKLLQSFNAWIFIPISFNCDAAAVIVAYNIKSGSSAGGLAGCA